MLYEPLSDYTYTLAKAEVACTSSFCCFYNTKLSLFSDFLVVFNKTIISLALVAYEMIYSQRGALRLRWLSAISYSTRARGIIAK